MLSGLVMLALYLAYKLFMARNNQHGYNRGALMVIYVLSFAVFPVMSLFQGDDVSSSLSVSAVGDIDVPAIAEAHLARPAWGVVAILVFFAGMAVVTVKTILIWVRLLHVVHSGEKIKKEEYTLVVTDNDKFAPFSWMRYIVISHCDYETSPSQVIVHELKHVANFHWIDLLVAQSVCIINWFNPAAWLMRDELMLVHEYQADMAVIDEGYNPQDYQILLIKKAVGARFPSLANSLNHSKLKKRITMMYKEKSGAGQKFKALALVPMFALALCVAGIPAVKATVSTISSCDVSVSKDNKKPAKTNSNVQTFKVVNINNNGNETTVTIKGEGLGNFLMTSDGTFTTMGKTYTAKSIQCNKTNEEATITVTFPFTSEYEKTSMTLNVNGETIPFDLDGFFDKARSIGISR